MYLNKFSFQVFSQHFVTKTNLHFQNQRNICDLVIPSDLCIWRKKVNLIEVLKTYFKATLRLGFDDFKFLLVLAITICSHQSAISNHCSITVGEAYCPAIDCNLPGL